MPATEDPEFGRLMDEALSHPLVGWDFSWIRGRVQRGEFPWNYTREVLRWSSRSPDLLDLGTGGGEWLSMLEPRPPRTVATESYGPNVRVAHARLAPLGIPVVPTRHAPDNTGPASAGSEPRLPFRSASFHLIVDRHESYLPREVSRVLAPGGQFVTQQVGEEWGRELLALFARRPLPASHPRWTMKLARRQVEEAGLLWEEGQEGSYETGFRDVGALVWYLRAIPWSLPDFDPRLERARLLAIHRHLQRTGPLKLGFSGFWFRASKPEGPPTPDTGGREVPRGAGSRPSRARAGRRVARARVRRPTPPARRRTTHRR